MAAGSGTPTQGPPAAKVSDVVNSFRPCRRFRPADSSTSVTSIDFDDSGELALISCDDDTLQIYNCKEGKHAKELKSQKYGVQLAKFTHHSQSIIYASTKVDDTIRYLSAHDNSYIRYFRGHQSTVTCLAVCPSSDTFMSCSTDDTVKFWALNSQNCQGQLNLNSPFLAAYDPSATVIAIASSPTNSVLLYDRRNYDKPPFATFDIPDNVQSGWGELPRGELTRLEFSNDGKNILLGTTGAGHFVLDAFDGSLKHLLFRRGGHTGRTPPDHHSAVNKASGARSTGTADVCLSPDGRFAVGGSGFDGMHVWDIHAPSTHDGVLLPYAELPGPGRAALAAYNHRLNLLCSADRDFLIWHPDPDSVP